MRYFLKKMYSFYLAFLPSTSTLLREGFKAKIVKEDLVYFKFIGAWEVQIYQSLEPFLKQLPGHLQDELFHNSCIFLIAREPLLKSYFKHYQDEFDWEFLEANGLLVFNNKMPFKENDIVGHVRRIEENLTEL